MTSTEVELARSVIAAFNAGVAEVDRVKSLVAKDAELRPLRAQLEGTAYIGPAGLVRFYEDLNADWQEFELVIDATHEAPGRAVVLGRILARGRASGITLDVPIGTLWEVGDGLLVRLEAFSEPSDALRAGGVPDD